MRILLCGNNSFAANGLSDKLLKVGTELDCFSRGEEKCIGNKITGNILRMLDNKYLDKTYDVVINFIIVKDSGIEENLQYIKALDTFCCERKVKRFIQISSISVYANNLKYINEESEIETDPNKKGGYASIKVAVDQYLLNKKSSYSVTFIRPGFIVSSEKKSLLAGIGFLLPFNFSVLLGNKKTSLPLINKERLHEGIIRIVLKDDPKPVYLLLENIKGTKYDFFRVQSNSRIIVLPKKVVMFVAFIAKYLKIFSTKQYLQVQGLFKNTYYDSSATECDLNYSLTKDSICVIGAGAYGSYTINLLCEKYPDAQITLFDVGDANVKNEDEIGYKSNILKAAYTGLAKGRFFGFGGATAKWGGQLLTFTQNDFSSPNQFMIGIIKLNEKYKKKVFARFGIENNFIENHITDKLFTKTGVWLGYFSRNLFNYFKISNKKNIRIIKNARVTRILVEGKRVLGIEFLHGGVIKRAIYEHYFLTAGAFECNRILLNSGLTKENKCSFSDHLSQKVFKIKGSAQIGSEDYAFGVNGTSLITKRMIGEIDGVSFFANPIYNAEFPFFQNLKRILFKHEYNLSVIKAVFADLPSVFAFAWSMLIKKKVYVYKNEWDLFIDIENPTSLSSISLSSDKDAFGEAALDVSFTIGEQASDIYERAKNLVREYLIANNVTFRECGDKIHVEKSEDTYHPYGMMCEFSSIEDYFTHFQNLLVINTGVLPRAGGINTTAVGFPLLEEYVSRYIIL